MSATAGNSSRRRWGIAGLVVIALTFSWLLFGGLDKNVVYFLTPTELVAKGPEVMEVPLRLGGLVKPGSVVWDEKALDLRFALVDTMGVGEVTVHSTGAPPQMFRDGMGVVVEGRYGRDGVFRSSNLMVMHSNEYRAPAEGERPQDTYQALFKETPK